MSGMRMTTLDPFKSAEEYFANPPITAGEKLQGHRNNYARKTDHLSYMDFAELYADYVVEYEKVNSRRSQSPAETGAQQ